jgi:hypothetical protein
VSSGVQRQSQHERCYFSTQRGSSWLPQSPVTLSLSSFAESNRVLTPFVVTGSALRFLPKTSAVRSLYAGNALIRVHLELACERINIHPNRVTYVMLHAIKLTSGTRAEDRLLFLIPLLRLS